MPVPALGQPLPRSHPWLDTSRLRTALNAAGPPLLFGIRLWISVSLALHVAFWLELDNAYWAGTSAALMCQPQLGASLRKGWFRMVGTVVGAIAIVVLTACFPQDRILFLLGLALWGATCGLLATLLHNFAAYAAALAGITVVIVAADELGAVGGPGNEVFTLAITRFSEITIGIVSAGIVLAGTDLGGARRGLARLLSALMAEIATSIAKTFALAGPNLPDTQSMRRDFLRRVIALDPVIDQAVGESSQIRYHTPVLQQAVDGLFAALAGWRAIANLLVRLPPEQAQADAAVVVRCFPAELQLPPERFGPAAWLANPIRLHRSVEAAVHRLRAFPAATPSQRLLADHAGESLTGLSDALNGLALLVRDPARPVTRRGIVRLRLPDCLPALVNAGRVAITIAVVALFWIVTAWPSGAIAVTWAAITCILFSPRADQAYASVLRFTAGTAVAAVFAAVVLFAVLPMIQTYTEFSLVLGAYFVPIGAMMAQSWETALFIPMTGNFLPLLAPANHMNYDPVPFYNNALALVAGCAAAAIAMRLVPPLSPAFRTRRLLALTRRDLRRLAAGRGFDDWESHLYGRLSAMPDDATPLQRAQLLAALSVGSEIQRLRQIMPRIGPCRGLGPALAEIARGHGRQAVAALTRTDAELAAREPGAASPQLVLHARASLLALVAALTRHGDYFDADPVP